MSRNQKASDDKIKPADADSKAFGYVYQPGYADIDDSKHSGDIYKSGSSSSQASDEKGPKLLTPEELPGMILQGLTLTPVQDEKAITQVMQDLLLNHPFLKDVQEKVQKLSAFRDEIIALEVEIMDNNPETKAKIAAMNARFEAEERELIAANKKLENLSAHLNAFLTQNDSDEVQAAGNPPVPKTLPTFREETEAPKEKEKKNSPLQKNYPSSDSEDELKSLDPTPKVSKNKKTFPVRNRRTPGMFPSSPGLEQGDTTPLTSEPGNQRQVRPLNRGLPPFRSYLRIFPSGLPKQTAPTTADDSESEKSCCERFCRIS
jgi:hypothetical protein